MSMLSVDSPNNCNTALQDTLEVCESIVHVNVVCWQSQQLQHCITRQTISCSYSMLSVDSPNNCNTTLQDTLEVCESIVHVNVVCWQYQQLQHCITRQTRSLWIHCSYSVLSVDSPNNCNTTLQDTLEVCESIVHIQCCLLTVPTIATLHYKTNYKFVNPLFIFNVVCWQSQQLQHYITRHTRSLWIHCSYSMLSVDSPNNCNTALQDKL